MPETDRTQRFPTEYLARLEHLADAAKGHSASIFGRGTPLDEYAAELLAHGPALVAEIRRLRDLLDQTRDLMDGVVYSDRVRVELDHEVFSLRAERAAARERSSS